LLFKKIINIIEIDLYLLKKIEFMNYCSNCGSDNIIKEIPVDDHRLRFTCKNCGKIFYENPRVVVGTIPIFNNKVLLAKRGIEPQKGKWNLPAGFLEMDETSKEGAIRETIEETGAEISDLTLHTIFQSDSNHLYILFLANLKSEKFNTTAESTEIEFFDFDSIPWDELAFTSNEFALKSLISNKNITNDIYFKME
jgi:ADP-ribose pyrophosphatase YjhB (NUDIX family)